MPQVGLLSRRTFLHRCRNGVLLLSIAPLFHEPGFHARTEVLDLIEIPGTSELFLDPQVQSYIRAGVVSLWVAGHFVNQFANQFESHLNFANLDPILVRKYQFAGQEFKNIPAARALWETIPAPIRARGNSALWNFHDGKDWSHIFPKAMGGSATAENGIWWSAKSNRQLGAVPMSRANIANAKFVLQSEAVHIVLLKSAKPLSAGGAIGALVGAFFAVMDYGLQYLEGKITRAELYQYVGQATLIELGLAILITGLIAGIALMFPRLVPLLLIVARPLAIVGFVSPINS